MQAERLVGHYAVIFVSQRCDGDLGYHDTAARMLQLASAQDGFLGVAACREPNGSGITVSYWRDLDAIAAWRKHGEHTLARETGRAKWYTSYQMQICKIERASAFRASPSEAASST